MMKKEKVVLVDSSYICYKSYFALPKLSHRNKRTSIIYGFLNQVFTIAKKVHPDQFIFFWDSKTSKRKEIFPEYKSKRKQERTEEEELEWKTAFAQFDQLRKRILPEIGFVNNFRQKGHEADDLIAKYCQDHGDKQELIIASADDDLLQLLDYCSILNLGKDKLVTAQDFIKEKGITPKQWIEVKKIVGCKSDQVPGIKGVGESTAIKFLRGELKPGTKTHNNIIDGKDVILRNEELVALPFSGTQAVQVKKAEFNMLGFLQLCRRYGMESFRNDKRKEEIKSLFLKGEVQNGKSKKRRRSSQESGKESSKKRKGFYLR